MKKILGFTALFIGFGSASYGQQLQKIISEQAYDNLNHDQQRKQQLKPGYAIIASLSGKPQSLPSGPIVKLSGNLPMDMLNNQRIRIDPVPDYVGKSAIKN